MRAINKVKDEGNKNSNRGNDVHDSSEHFVRGNQPMAKPLEKFKDNFLELKESYDKGRVLLEENWGFDIDWGITDWFSDTIWLRMKLDAFEWKDDSQVAARAIDYKTGKRFGNEVKHAQQGQLYAIGAFMRYPTLQLLDVEFWYLDHNGKPVVWTYTREQAMKLMVGYNNRLLNVTTCTQFKPKPSKMNCMWCPYGKENGNAYCEWAHEA